MPIVSKIDYNFTDEEVLVAGMGRVSIRAYWWTLLLTDVGMLIMFGSIGASTDGEIGAALLVGAFFSVITTALFLSAYPFMRKKRLLFDNFCKVNRSFCRVSNWTPLEMGAQSGKAPSCIWNTIDSMGRTSHDTDLNMAYGVVYNGLEGTGENGVDFHLGRLDRVGPYAGYWFISLDLPHEFPQVFIDADAKGSLLNESNFRLRIKDGYRYELEGSFADYFTLYAAQSTAVRVATYILTPDVMQQVLSVAPHVDIEFHRDKLYILWLPQQRTPRETLIDGFGILNSVGEPLFERAAKYLHMEETVSAELLNADISFNAFTEAAQNIGKVGGRDIRKAASIALSKRSFARVAIFVGALAFGFGVFVLYLYVRYFSPIAWH